MKKKRPMLQDVADRVGATKMTVSRFLYNPKWVPVALRDKIATVLDELGYIPNRAPNILSNATSHAIDVLLSSLTNQVLTEVPRGIEVVTDAHGYQTIPAYYGHKPEMEQERLGSILSWNIDGLIFTRCNHTPRTLKIIEVAGIPVVELMDSQPPCLNTVVGFDSFEAARQMTIVIIARGHRHVAYLDVRLDEHTTIKQRGYEQAMRDVNLVPYSMMVGQPSSYSSGIELIRQAWREYPQPDGIFCINDDPAVGAAFECQRLGLRIPDDMAIARLYGHDTGQMMGLRLASILAPRKRMGSIGAERLLARIRGETVTPKMLDSGFTLLPGRSI